MLVFGTSRSRGSLAVEHCTWPVRPLVCLFCITACQTPCHPPNASRPMPPSAAPLPQGALRKSVLPQREPHHHAQQQQQPEPEPARGGRGAGKAAVAAAKAAGGSGGSGGRAAAARQAVAAIPRDLLSDRYPTRRGAAGAAGAGSAPGQWAERVRGLVAAGHSEWGGCRLQHRRAHAVRMCFEYSRPAWLICLRRSHSWITDSRLVSVSARHSQQAQGPRGGGAGGLELAWGSRRPARPEARP